MGPVFDLCNKVRHKPTCAVTIHIGSYMRAHILLNLLNKLGKRDIIQGVPNILSLFRNKFNELNNTRAQILDSIYHMTLRSL